MSRNIVDKDTGELIVTASGTRVWIGTKSAHDLAVQQSTMPNNCMVCITDDAPGDEAWQYSTEETRTGKTWVDGKPIYRKVVDFGALPNASNKNVNHGISNLDYVVSYEGLAYDSTTRTFYPLPTVSISTNAAQTNMAITSSAIEIVTAENRSSRRAYIVLEYTKSTD